MAGATKSPSPAAGQIWFIDEPRLGNSEHGHFALVTQLFSSSRKATINFIATESTFHDDFRIDETAEGFTLTGLEHSSHLLRKRTQEIDFEILLKGKLKGILSGKLKSDIEEWWGEKL
jgi:hypothetical protein